MKKGVWIYVIGITLLVIGIFFDRQISVLLSGIRFNLLNDFMLWISYFGAGFFVLIFMTSLFLWQERKREYIVPLWASVIISLVSVYLIKLVSFRLRPDMIESLVNYSDSSFPSAHAAAVFSTLAILDKEFPKFKWFWLLFACLVGFSRIYLGVHYLTDVIFSALFGGSIGLLMLKKKRWFDSSKSKDFDSAQKSRKISDIDKKKVKKKK